ncbi:MAG: hypothetical protein LIP03_03000 [Bacteroidales bacterium]|nr:hypothetical protein [Bacteroidales bacterium]
MTQMTLTISDPKDATLIRKLLAKFDSVTISKPKRKTRFELALEEVENGEYEIYTNREEYLKRLGI